MCESVGMITCQWCCSVCSILTQDLELNNACFGRGLKDVQSAIQRGANPNWMNPSEVSLQLVHSQCCVSSGVASVPLAGNVVYM